MSFTFAGETSCVATSPLPSGWTCCPMRSKRKICGLTGCARTPTPHAMRDTACPGPLAQRRAHAHVHARTHAHAQARTHPHACIRTHANEDARTRSCARSHASQSRTRSHAQAHALTRACLARALHRCFPPFTYFRSKTHVERRGQLLDGKGPQGARIIYYLTYCYLSKNVKRTSKECRKRSAINHHNCFRRFFWTQVTRTGIPWWLDVKISILNGEDLAVIKFRQIPDDWHFGTYGASK